MGRTKHVNVTSDKEKQDIINTSVQALSTNVVGQAAELKKRFVLPITNIDGRPSATGVIDRVVNETEAALDEVYNNINNSIEIVQSNNVIFQKTVSATDSGWEEVDGEWRYGVLKSEHLLDSIRFVNVEKKTESGVFENILYSYELDSSVSIVIVLDKQIDMKIILQGDKNNPNEVRNG